MWEIDVLDHRGSAENPFGAAHSKTDYNHDPLLAIESLLETIRLNDNQ